MKKFICLFALLNLLACSSTRNAYYDKKVKNWQEIPNTSSKSPVHTLYLIGNTGAVPASGENKVLDELQKMLEQENESSSLVYLGDQLEPEGMPSKKNKNRARAEQILNQQLDIVRNFSGRTYFIPGEKDWKNGQKKGLKALKRQEKYLENYFSDKQKVKMYPGNGCADPKVMKINKDLVFIFLDSQWWLQNWTHEKSINQGCDVSSRHDLLKHIEETLSIHKNDEVVIFMHHPILSNGNYGGYFSLGDQLFPLKETKNVSVPLPIIGSFVSLYRKISGTSQDLSNSRYKELMLGIQGIAQAFRMNVLFASAHDHSLQHFSQGKLHYIVSGSGAKSHYTTKGKGVNFAIQQKGFCKVQFYPEFEMWAEFYAMNESGNGVELVYKKQLRAPRVGTVEEQLKHPPVITRDTTLAANPKFAAGAIKRAFFGKQYREMWATPVKVPLIDLEKQFGGLTPIKKGGGMASNSLRMQTEGGKQYILRSINKDYRKAIAPEFRNLKLINVVKDQNSAGHPYGPLIIPNLSKAAGAMQLNLETPPRSSVILTSSTFYERRKVILLIKTGWSNPGCLTCGFTTGIDTMINGVGPVLRKTRKRFIGPSPEIVIKHSTNFLDLSLATSRLL